MGKYNRLSSFFDLLISALWSKTITAMQFQIYIEELFKTIIKDRLKGGKILYSTQTISRITPIVPSLSHVQLFATPWTAARHSSLSSTISWSLLKLMSIQSVMPSSYLVLCRPLLLLFTASPSCQGLFQRVSFSHQVAKLLEHQLPH